MMEDKRQEISVEELLKPRWKCIDKFPDMENYQVGVGDIFGITHHLNPEGAEVFYNTYPNLFRKLEWWEDRTLDAMVSVKYGRVVKYVGYWRVGDVVQIVDYEIEKGKFIRYEIAGNRHYRPDQLSPATESDYKLFREYCKGNITEAEYNTQNSNNGRNE